VTTSGPGPTPDLEPAHPSGAVAGTYQPRDNIPAEVRFTDQTWQYAEITGLARNIDGQWRIRLLWYGTDAQGHRSQMEDWWLYREDAFREPQEP
jgi:hypothetical protein